MTTSQAQSSNIHQWKFRGSQLFTVIKFPCFNSYNIYVSLYITDVVSHKYKNSDSIFVYESHGRSVRWMNFLPQYFFSQIKFLSYGGSIRIMVWRLTNSSYEKWKFPIIMLISAILHFRTKTNFLQEGYWSKTI